ncbi:hypothetical protein C8R43DRAFT_1079102 [Mycena crocata]|nr:hypothetical protein C8R43DRAFT_1079102 [Mycena crocata]
MRCRPFAQLARRRYSALPKLKPATNTATTVQLLEATAEFVPQVLADDPAKLKVWSDVLSIALTDARSVHPRPARLVVCGTDTAGARDVVTALLEEPFTSVPHHTSALRQRWTAVPPGQTSLTIEYGAPAADESLRLPLAYLDQFPVPLQVIEAADPALLHTADVAVIVSRVDELHALSFTRPDSLVVLNIDEAESSQPRASTSRLTAAPSKYLFVSPSQALSALTALKKSPGSPEAVQRYQTDFVASRMPTLAQTLHGLLSSLKSQSILRNRTALVQIRSALAACRDAIRDARTELDRIATGISDLDARVEEERVKVQREVFGLPEDHAVDRALADATKQMEYKIGYMKWRRQLFGIDELTVHITSTVRRVWCLGLEKEARLPPSPFRFRRLERMQRDLTERTFALLAPSNTRALHSPVLQNALRQLATAPTFPVIPTTLAAPLGARANQILGASTSQLHVTGQRALMGMIAGTAVGASINWIGWAGWLVDTLGVSEPATTSAVGILVGLSSVYWASRRWDNGRKRWWEDFMRVASGLKGDITVRNRLFVCLFFSLTRPSRRRWTRRWRTRFWSLRGQGARRWRRSWQSRRTSLIASRSS